jgi:periplasmic protein TonB
MKTLFSSFIRGFFLQVLTVQVLTLLVLFMLPNQTMAQPTQTSAADPNKLYNMVEELPQYPGGEAEMMRFLSKELKYPRKARKQGKEGTVYIGFVVEKDGSITYVQVKRAIKDDVVLGKEAMRVVKKMPKWTPGKMQNQPVRVLYTLPIKFSLS